jgi:glycine/D-amino acid oxidase-like deaminating enzyme
MTPDPGDGSLWLAEVGAIEEPAEALEGEASADVCVVGGGYTGLWTAIELRRADPSLDVALLDARTCGSGASGVNGGFALSWWSQFLKLERICGTDQALMLADCSARAVDDLERFCADNAIDAGLRRGGWLYAAAAPAQVGATRELVERLSGLGVDALRAVGADEAARMTGSRTHLGGVCEERGATVQPAALARGLRRVAVERGVRVFERSPMRRLEHGARPRVETPTGSIRAGVVVLAMGAWLARFPELRRHLTVIGSDIVATAPAPETLEASGWRAGLAISDHSTLVRYYRTTGDGRLVFGQGGGDLGFRGRVGTRFRGGSRRTAEIVREMTARYPDLAGAGVAHTWTGPVDYSATTLPFFGHLDGAPNVLFGGGFSGNGVAPSMVGARILSSLALGRENELTASGLVDRAPPAFPPEPVRYLGGRLVRAAAARADRSSLAGREPGRVTVALAALSPRGAHKSSSPQRENGRTS